MAKTVAIIGAGVAGLSAGIFGQLSGLSTRVFEMHSAPGGLCTAWKRKDYWFDGCIRYVYGSKPGESFYPLMQQIGAAGIRPYVHHGEVTRVETSAGPTVVFYCDLDRLERHLLEVSPGDGQHIRPLTNAARTLSRASVPVKTPSSVGELVASAPALARFMWQFIRWGKVTLREVAAGFHSPALREAFTRYYGYADLTELPVFILLLDLAQHSVGNAGWPQGGSRQLALDIERRYISLGGEVHYNCRVERILVEDGKAVGIRLADGQEHRVDAVISGADGLTTLNSMLEGRYTHAELRQTYESATLIPPLVQVSLGVARDLALTPRSVDFPLNQPVTIAGITYSRMHFTHYCYDQSMAPQGKSSVVVVFETSYPAWKTLAGNRDAYEAEKRSAAQQVIDRLDWRFPGFRSQVEAMDVATPLTYERYTGNRQGSPQGWQTTPGNLRRSFPQKLPGLASLYMAGQWAQQGGGIPGCARSGHNAVRLLCRDLGQPFRGI